MVQKCNQNKKKGLHNLYIATHSSWISPMPSPGRNQQFSSGKHWRVSVVVGIAQQQSNRLKIERSLVPVPAGAGEQSSSPESTFCAQSYFGISSTPLLLQQDLKILGHPAKNAGGRLQLNTQTPYNYMWLGIKWHCKRVHGLWCIQNIHQDNSSFTWHQPCNN